MERTVGDSISLITPGYDHAKSWLLERLRENNLPDVMLAHGSDLSVLHEGQARSLFSSVAGEYEARNPVRAELQMFHDPEGLLYPLYVVPMVMIYNKKFVDEKMLAKSWTDILCEKWTVVFPDRHAPISKVVLAYLKKSHPQEFAAFMQRVEFKNSPVEAVQTVALGKFQFGIANISFSMMAKQRNVEINWPAEGPVPIPQVLTWKKGARPSLTNIADVLRKPDLQQYLGQQGFWAVAGDMPPEVSWQSTWRGWPDFLAGIKALDE